MGKLPTLCNPVQVSFLSASMIFLLSSSSCLWITSLSRSSWRRMEICSCCLISSSSCATLDPTQAVHPAHRSDGECEAWTLTKFRGVMDNHILKIYLQSKTMGERCLKVHLLRNVRLDVFVCILGNVVASRMQFGHWETEKT